MNIYKLAVAITLAASWGARAQVFNPGWVNQMVPDGTTAGLASGMNLVTSIPRAKRLEVGLELSPGPGGAFSGDLFVMLIHGDPLHPAESAVLLNRPGRDATHPFGYADGVPLRISLSVDATEDVHDYRRVLNGDPDIPLSGPLTGSWQPDGRTASPLVVETGSLRNGGLDRFAEMDPNGEWVLFVADLSQGGTWNLVSWSLQVLPEPPPPVDPDAPGISGPVLLNPDCGPSVLTGASVSLSVTPTGTGPYHFQWFSGFGIDAQLLGEGASLTFTTPGITRDTDFWVRLTTPVGTVDSIPLRVVVRSSSVPIPKDDLVFRASGNSLVTLIENLGANDLHAEGAIAEFDPVSANGGRVSLIGDLLVTYEPPVGIEAMDSFRYRWRTACGGVSADATVYCAVSPPPSLWEVGQKNIPPSHAEFRIENAKADPAPGLVTRVPGDPEYAEASNPAADDDFYFTGNYPAGFNGLTGNLSVPLPEPPSAWERALTTRDRTNRMHFVLSPAQLTPGATFHLSFGFVSGKRRIRDVWQPGFGRHQVAVRFKNAAGATTLDELVVVTNATEFTLNFSAATVGAAAGPNTIEFERIGPNADLVFDYLTFDYVRLDLTAPPALPSGIAKEVRRLEVLQFALEASDDATPPSLLAFAKISGPAGLTISPRGMVEWTPGAETALGVYTVEVEVSDHGTPPLKTRGQFTVEVLGDLSLQLVGTTGCLQEEVLVPVRARGFRGIGSLQGTIRWDPSVATLLGVQSFGLPALSEESFALDGTGGRLRMVWADPTFAGASVPENTDLFTLRFKLRGPRGVSTPLEFYNDPMAWRIFDASDQLLDPHFQGGQLVSSCAITTTFVAGSVRYYHDQTPVGGLDLSLRSSGLNTLVDSTHTGSDGAYLFQIPQPATSVTISGAAPLGLEPPDLGITMRDWLRLREHLLGLHRLTPPFELLAADVDANNEIDSRDLRQIVLLVQQELTAFPGIDGSWLILTTDFTPSDPAIPWAWKDHHSYSYDPAQLFGGVIVDQDFVGIKRGDVDGSWGMGPSLALRRGIGEQVSLAVDRQIVESGGMVKVSVRASAIQLLTTAQFSLGWDPTVLRFRAVEGFGLRGMDAASFGLRHVGSGALTLGWGDPQTTGVMVEEGQTLFTVAFDIVGAPGSSSMVRVTSNPTLGELSIPGQVVPFTVRNGLIAVRRSDGGALALLPAESGQLGLWFEMPTDGHWVLETSEDLLHWVPLSEPAPASGGGLTQLDLPEGDEGKHFYRVTFGP